MINHNAGYQDQCCLNYCDHAVIAAFISGNVRPESRSIQYSCNCKDGRHWNVRSHQWQMIYKGFNTRYSPKCGAGSIVKVIVTDGFTQSFGEQ